MDMGKIFVGIAILSLIVGIVGRSSPIVDGLGKALFGVFFILYLIDRLFGEKETS